MSPALRYWPISPPRSRTAITVTGVGALLAMAITACSPADGPAGNDSSAAGPVPGAPAAENPPMALPAAPQPVAEGPCRYLPAAAVQSANGQRVAAVRVSATGPDQPYPACFFLTGAGTVQLRTWILVTTPAAAHAAIDAAAPVATSDRAELAGGWSGGSQPTTDGAVFAVAHHGTAVVITTNQHQTISARQIAEQVISALNL